MMDDEIEEVEFTCPFCGGTVFAVCGEVEQSYVVHSRERICAQFIENDPLDFLIMMRRAYGIVAPEEMN